MRLLKRSTWLPRLSLPSQFIISPEWGLLLYHDGLPFRGGGRGEEFLGCGGTRSRSDNATLDEPRRT